MSTFKLSNISLAEMRTFLTNYGLTKVTCEGGHEKWQKKGLLRPIILQTHVDPVPEFIVMNIYRNLNLTRKKFVEIFTGKS